jgi:DNA invertase Pin-like site-specific DNA recombinase
MTRAARYRRVSHPTEEIENQSKDTLDLISQLGLELDPRYDCTDTGSAWSEHPRLPQRDRLLRDAEAGLLKGYTLVVWAADRVSRDPVDLLALLRRLKVTGVRLVSCREPWLDSGGPFGEVMVFLAGWAAGMESARKSERVKAAFARKRAAGERLGRKPKAIDWQLLERMRGEGFGLRRIAKALDVSIGTVHKALKLRKTIPETRAEPTRPAV